MSFWQNKRVLITGADGFLGSNLTKALLMNNAKVTTFTKNTINPNSILNFETLIDQIDDQAYGTIEDYNKLNQLIDKNKIEIIYHLAALPLVEIGQTSPLETYQVNINGTLNILEAGRVNKIKHIVTVSTAHVYGDNPNLPLLEEYTPKPSRPYETSKACADLIAKSYSDSYGLCVDIPRFVNLYGPGDLNFSRIVPKVIKTVIDGKNPKLWKSDSVRDFLYVDDATSALLRLCENPNRTSNDNRIYNFGSGQPIKISELAKLIVKLANRKNITIEFQDNQSQRKNEIAKQYVSIEKAMKELSWQPQTSIKTGIMKSLEWYEQHIKMIR